MSFNLLQKWSSGCKERLTFLAALDPINAGAFKMTLAAFKAGEVNIMILFGNEAALGLLRGILDHGPLDRFDWTLARLLRSLGALDTPVPSFTVAVRQDPGNVARFKTAWAALGFEGAPPSVPATLTWTFIVDASYQGVPLEPLWRKRHLLAEIDGYQLFQAPDMLGFSRS
ncbi:MAG: hypothetical protein ABL955_08670 [Elusimicrobiota bacterium]